jgi:DnaK suppressor protein
MKADTARKLLEAERARLDEVLSTLEQESLDETQQASMQELSSVDQHIADMGTETFEREKAESIKISMEGQLADVERALGRLESGEYGVCEICGKKIPDARLQARPAARYCVEDQEKVERQAVDRKPEARSR